MPRFQFSLSMLLWLMSACAFATATWIIYHSSEQREEYPLAVGLVNLGLTSTLAGTLLSMGSPAKRSRRERLAVSAMVGLLVGLAVHFIVINLLGTKGALVALVMREDALVHRSIPGMVVRVVWGIFSAVVISVVKR